MNNPQQKLPKLYAPVNIKFGSLRLALGPNLGVMEIDEDVVRKCRRVITKDGWKWQIVNFHILSQWDGSVFADQDILDDYDEYLEYEIV